MTGRSDVELAHSLYQHIYQHGLRPLLGQGWPMAKGRRLQQYRAKRLPSAASPPGRRRA